MCMLGATVLSLRRVGRAIIVSSGVLCPARVSLHSHARKCHTLIQKRIVRRNTVIFALRAKVALLSRD